MMALAFSQEFAAAADPPMTMGQLKFSTDPTKEQQTIQLGDLKFAFGPQSSGDFGATLKGGVAEKLASLHDSGCYAAHAPDDMACSDWYAVLNANVDAAWSSAAHGSTQNENNATIVLNPSIYYEYGHRHFSSTLSEINGHIAGCNRSTPAGLSGPALLKAKEANPGDCFYQSPPPFSHNFVLSLYPDIEYRYGTFNQAGSTYTANQLLVGTGAKVLYPARIGGFLANWPYLSLGYDVAKNYGNSDLPTPSSFQDHYIVANGRIEFFIPGFKALTGVTGIALIDLTDSKQTGGVGRSSGWQVARMFQLIIDTTGAGGLKPALTYRSGVNRGMTYDRQVIFGVLWNILGGPNGPS